MIRAERLEPAIRERVWSISPPRSGGLWSGTLLLTGKAFIEDDRETLALSPVSVFLAQVDRERAFRVQAGAEAITVTFPEQIVWASIGRGPESPEIRRMLERPAVSQLVDRGRMAEHVERAFETILAEANSDAPGQATMIEASLKQIFGTLLRNLPERDHYPQALDRGSNLLLRFRQLLENRFRDRWAVGQYARELGISPDRLHDLTTTKLAKTPSALIRERTFHEAQMLLARSSLSIKEISDRLGFRDPAHFSTYFKTLAAKSPRLFRHGLARSPDPKSVPDLDFAEWP